MGTLEDLRTRAKAAAMSIVDGGGVGVRTQKRLDRRGDDPAPRPVRKTEYVMDDDGNEYGRSPVDTMVLCKAEHGSKEHEFQKFQDEALIMRLMLKSSGKDLRDTKWYREKMQKHHPVRKMLKQLDSETAGDGLEWVPTNFSADFVRLLSLETKVINQLTPINPMPSDPYKVPIITANMTVYFIAEQLGDAGTKITAGDPTTSNFQLDAKKIGVRTPFSTEVEEDSIVPILSATRENMATAVADGQEDAVLNGDTSGTHQDNDVTTSTDIRKMYRGLRFHGLSSASFKATMSTPLVAADLRSLRAKMGKYGVNPNNLIMIVGPIVYQKGLLALADVVTVEKYGPSAVVLTGELARWDGIPVIVSGQQRENLNVSGVKDSTTTNNGTIMFVSRKHWYWGTKRAFNQKVWENIEFDQKYLVGTARHALSTPITTEPVCVIGVDADAS